MSKNINDLRYNSKKAETFFAKKMAYTLGPVELKIMLQEKKVKVIDVRYEDDYNESHIIDAVCIPKNQLESRLSELSKTDLHVVYCYNQQCHLATNAAFILAKNDYPVMELEGGFKVWKNDFEFEVI